MCNLYANTMPQDAMRRLFNSLDRLGNQEPLTAIFPDAEVPIVRIGETAPVNWSRPGGAGTGPRAAG